MIAPARAAAFAALQQISSDDVMLGEALARARTRVDDPRDRALVNEIVTGTLRHRLALDYQLSLRLARRLDKLDAAVLTALRLSAFQLLHLTRVPAAAIVNDAASLVRAAGKSSAAGLVNAVLRRLARERDALAWPERPSVVASSADRAKLVAQLSTVYSHPTWLVHRWLDRFGAEATEQWLQFNNTPAPLTLATNTARITREALAAALASEGVSTRPTTRAPHGLVVTEGRPLHTRAFHEGLCLVQDEASQLVADVVPVRAGDRLLDACAAPGGKTVALAARAGVGGVVMATDVRARRLQTLRETITRSALDNVHLVHIEAEGPLPFRPGTFNAVLIDAPCSGLGTLRRDPDIRWRREPADLTRFAEAQRRLLERVAPLVAPAGYLVYSTCSSEPDENEAVVDGFLATTTGFAAPTGFLTTLPFRDGLEAFFAAVLQRLNVRSAAL